MTTESEITIANGKTSRIGNTIYLNYKDFEPRIITGINGHVQGIGEVIIDTDLGPVFAANSYKTLNEAIDDRISRISAIREAHIKSVADLDENITELRGLKECDP